MRHHGNLNWLKPNVPVPFLPTEFEQQVEKLRLSPDEYQDSPKLRDWCLKNATSHYVPEYLLKVWGIDVKEGWGSPTEYVLTTRRH
jgi:hypothetical protein